MGSWRTEPPEGADESGNVALAGWLALALVLVFMIWTVMAPSYLRWPPGCTPIELYDVSGEVTVIPDGEVCELDAWP
jgi:hypothetical protein